MISSVETLSSNGSRTSAAGGAVAVRSSWAASSPASAVRTSSPPCNRTVSPVRGNDPPYLFVGQRPARQLRRAQHVLYHGLAGLAAVDGEPVTHVARARGRVDEDLLFPAEQARRYPGIHAVLGERVALLVRLEDRRRVYPRTGLEDVAPHRRIVLSDRDAEHPRGAPAVLAQRLHVVLAGVFELAVDDELVDGGVPGALAHPQHRAVNP